MKRSLAAIPIIIMITLGLYWFRETRTEDSSPIKFDSKTSYVGSNFKAGEADLAGPNLNPHLQSRNNLENSANKNLKIHTSLPPPRKQDIIPSSFRWFFKDEINFEENSPQKNLDKISALFKISPYLRTKLISLEKSQTISLIPDDGSSYEQVLKSNRAGSFIFQEGHVIRSTSIKLSSVACRLNISINPMSPDGSPGVGELHRLLEKPSVLHSATNAAYISLKVDPLSEATQSKYIQSIECTTPEATPVSVQNLEFIDLLFTLGSKGIVLR
jgi:hypothetical protein